MSGLLKTVPSLPALATIPDTALIPVWSNGALYNAPAFALKGGSYDLLAYGGLVTTKADAQSDSKRIAKANTAALQAAAQAASDAGAGVVTLPVGDIWFDHGLIDANVVCQVSGMSRVAFVGGGAGVTRLHIVDGAESNLFNLTGGSSYITIRDMEIDGNRAAQSLGVSGIRGDAFSGVWLENLYIHDIYHYGIGFQGFVQQFIFMNNIKLENLGGDGFDQKNKADSDLFQTASNIHIINHGLNLAENTQAGWDCRGAWQLSNFVIHYTRSDGTGIRFRQGDAAEPDVGFGGHRSHVSNIEIYGPGAASTATGIECVARDVTVTGGYVRDVLFGVGCYYDTLALQGAERCSFKGVTVENYGTAGFITSTGADGNDFENCTARGNGVGTYGFRVRSSGCRIINPRADGNTNTDISLDTAATFTEIQSPKLIGTSSLGISVAAADCTVNGGHISGHATNLSVSAARFTMTGGALRAATGDNVLVAVGGDDARFNGVSSRGAASEGFQTRAARTVVNGGESVGNGGLGFQSEATASDCQVLDLYLSGNAAEFDDQGVNTTIRRSAPVARSINEAVASAGTSANIDVPLISATTVTFVVQVNMEASGSARCTLRTRYQAYRSASGSVVVSAGTSEFSTGTGLTINASGSGNNFRVNVSNTSGANVRLDTKIFEVFREKTVEFS